MKQIFAGIITAGILYAGSAFAVIYQYTDDTGQVYYTNDLSSVPEEKRAGAVRFEEYESDAVPENASPVFDSMPAPSGTSDSYQQASDLKNSEHQKKLEAEYNTLLKEKKALDNNVSFQKRRKKRKYQNRPHIQALIKKEEKIINRLSELEAELKDFEKP